MKRIRTVEQTKTRQIAEFLWKMGEEQKILTSRKGAIHKCLQFFAFLLTCNRSESANFLARTSERLQFTRKTLISRIFDMKDERTLFLSNKAVIKVKNVKFRKKTWLNSIKR